LDFSTKRGSDWLWGCAAGSLHRDNKPVSGILSDGTPFLRMDCWGHLLAFSGKNAKKFAIRAIYMPWEHHM
jgi:hypothetical protein